MKKSKKKYFLYILLFFIAITLIPIIIFLFTKNQYAFSLSLIPIVLANILLFKISIINKISKTNFIWGIISFFYPLVVIFIIGLFAVFFDRKVIITIYYFKTIDFFITLLVSFIVLLFTEEIIFRGISWSFFDRLEISLLKKNFVISLLFVLWHIPVIILFSDFQLKPFVIPIYFLNIFLFSFIIGMFRYFSNSIIFVTICHALWNTLVYIFFGFGKSIGAWRIKKYFLFDPERGLLGIVLQGLIILFLLFTANIKQNKS